LFLVLLLERNSQVHSSEREIPESVPESEVPESALKRKILEPPLTLSSAAINYVVLSMYVATPMYDTHPHNTRMTLHNTFLLIRFKVQRNNTFTMKIIFYSS